MQSLNYEAAHLWAESCNDSTSVPRMVQPASEAAVSPTHAKAVLQGTADTQPDVFEASFDQDDFDATAYINELFPTGAHPLPSTGWLFLDACLVYNFCTAVTYTHAYMPTQKPALQGWTRQLGALSRRCV